jgi:hypothetical protein
VYRCNSIGLDGGGKPDANAGDAPGVTRNYDRCGSESARTSLINTYQPWVHRNACMCFSNIEIHTYRTYPAFTFL